MARLAVSVYVLTVDSVVADLAPIVVFHEDEEYWPIEPADFIAQSTLRWAGPGSDGWVVGPDEDDAGGRLTPSRLTSEGPDGYEFAGHRACDYTRPFDGRPSGLASREGFFLALGKRDDRRGTPSRSADADVYEGVSAFFEFDVSGRAITYWFFYAASTVPYLLWEYDLHLEVGPEDPDAEARALLGGHEPEAILDELNVGYGDVLEVQPVAALDVNPLRWAAGQLQRLRWYLGSDELPVAHEGDWERITLQLDASLEPTHIVYYQHHGARRCPWRRRNAGERPIVYSARGSHATFSRSFRGLDDTSRPGRRWRTWESLQDVHQAWFGFGGAWGKVGSVADATGPLGPSRWKHAAARFGPCSR